MDPPPCLNHKFTQKWLLWGLRKADCPSKCWVGCQDHTPGLSQHTIYSLAWLTSRDAGSCSSMGLGAMLQLHLGHCYLVYLIRTIGKAQCSGPGKELSQGVVAAQASCSKGLETQSSRGSPG
jgi:hypothetical protein